MEVPMMPPPTTTTSVEEGRVDKVRRERCRVVASMIELNIFEVNNVEGRVFLKDEIWRQGIGGSCERSCRCVVIT